MKMFLLGFIAGVTTAWLVGVAALATDPPIAAQLDHEDAQ